MRTVLSFLFLFCFSFAATEEVSVFVQEPKERDESGFVADDTGFIPDKQEDLSLTGRKSLGLAKSLFVSYEEVPNKGYVDAYIPIKIKAIVAREFKYLRVVNPKKQDAYVGNFKSGWEKTSDNVYLKTIFFKAKKPLSKLPSLKVDILGKNGIIESAYLPQKEIDIVRLGDDEGRFINVFAEKLEVKKIKTNRFDEQNLIMVLEINAQKSNLKDINFQNIARQGIDTRVGDYFESTVFYFIVFPKDKLSIKMSYFDTLKNDFQIIRLPVNIEKEDLSTQVDLNPKKSEYELYKEIFIVVLSLLFLIVFYFRRSYVYVAISLVFFSYFLYINLSVSTVYLYENTRVRILPTENSTIFYTTTGIESVEKLNNAEPYIKVLLPNKKIGWIKNEDVIKN